MRRSNGSLSMRDAQRLRLRSTEEFADKTASLGRKFNVVSRLAAVVALIVARAELFLLLFFFFFFLALRLAASFETQGLSKTSNDTSERSDLPFIRSRFATFPITLRQACAPARLLL